LAGFSSAENDLPQRSGRGKLAPCCVHRKHASDFRATADAVSPETHRRRIRADANSAKAECVPF
jgi:hypothetical protein